VDLPSLTGSSRGENRGYDFVDAGSLWAIPDERTQRGHCDIESLSDSIEKLY
jgi:hypothetical protein